MNNNGRGENVPEISNYDLDKRIALLEQTVLRLSDSLDKINASINKLVWAVGGAIIITTMKFILSGGLGVTP